MKRYFALISRHSLTILTFLCLTGTVFSLPAQPSTNHPPNIIVILADDLGFSDIGCYGSEIRTPNLDRLASEGVRMTRFYNTARCCPSRASLLTGLYPHQAGMGLMSDQEITIPSYQGYLNKQSATIAELLSEKGYHTSISGKWHVGDERENWPDKRGFERSFSFIHGASSYFDNGRYRNKDWPWSDGEIFTVLDGKKFDYPDGTYSTNLYTDYALKFIAEAQQQDRPFFLYLAYTAPHWPLHALPEDIKKYKGKYDQGWDQIRKQRLEKQKTLGLFSANQMLSFRDPDVPAWETLSEVEQSKYARMMEVYAAMIDRMDQNIGRVIEHLESMGILDNTLIVFLSDNGGCRAEWIPYKESRFSEDATIGSPESFTGYGKGWANVSNTPFRNFKATVHQGGIASPLIARLPGSVKPRSLNTALTHITDIMPTCLELAGVDYPETFNGNKLKALPGKSLLPMFSGETTSVERTLFFEHSGRRAMIRNQEKLVWMQPQEWEYYDLSIDPVESQDLVPMADPAQLSDMIFRYNRWAHEAGVFPKHIVNLRTVTKHD